MDGGTLSANRDVTLTATTTASASGIAAGRDATVSGRTGATLANATAGRDISLSSSAGSASGSNLQAGGDIAVNVAGAASLSGSMAGGDLGIAAGGSASGTSLTAGRDLSINATGAVSLAGGTAGDDITISGAVVAITSANTTGSFVESGYGADGSNIVVNSRGPIDVTGTANAFDTLRLTSSGGAITANVLTAGNDAIVSGGTLAIASVTSRGTSTESGYGATPDGSNIRLTASAPGTATLPAIRVTTGNAANDLVANATNAAGTIGTGTLTAGRDLSVTAGGAIVAGQNSAGRDGTFASNGGAIVATGIVAGRNIAVRALGDVTLGDAIANGPVILSTAAGDPAPTSGLVTITAGRAGTTGAYGAADVTLNGTVSATGHVLVTAGRDVVVGPSAQLRSNNRLTLNAGDDILIRSGAAVSAALAPAPVSLDSQGGIVSPAALVLNAGSLALNYTPPAGNVAALIVDGTLASAGRPITLTAGAIQADGSALTAGTLTANVRNAPAAGAAQSNDGGQLRTGCLQGDLCLGAVTLTGLTAGTTQVPGALSIGANGAPTNVRIAGAVDVASIAVNAQDAIYLGNAATTTAIAQTAAGQIALNAGGAVNLLGNITLTGGAATGPSLSGRTVAIAAGSDVAGATAAIVSRGPLQIDAGGSVTLASTRSAEATRINANGGDIQVGSLTSTTIDDDSEGPGSGIFLTAAGNVAGVSGGIADVDATGDVYVRAGGDVALGTVNARNGATTNDSGGSDIDIQANGAVGIANGTASDDATVAAGGDLTIGTLIANGEAGGGALILTGGNIGAGTLSAANAIDATAGQRLRVDNATSPGTISLVANGTDAPADDGTLAVTLGTVDAGTSLDIGAMAGGIGFASLAAPSIALNAGTRIAGGDVTARGGDVSASAPGDIVFGTVTADGSITADAGGAFTANGLFSATGDDENTGDIAITAGTTLNAGTVQAGSGNIRLGAGTDATLDTVAASGDVAVTTGGSATATSVAAGGAISFGSGDAITIGSATAGSGAGGAIDLTAAGAVTIGTAMAGDAITIGGATIQADALTTTRPDDGESGIMLASSDAIEVTALNSGATATIRSTNGPVTLGSGAARGTLRITSGGDTTTGALTVSPTTGTNAGAGDLFVTSSGAATFNAPVTAASATIAAGDAIGFDGLTVTGNADLRSARAAITGDTIIAGGTINLAAAGAVRIATDIRAGNGQAGAITVTGTDIGLNALGDLSLSTLDATDGSVVLQSAGGAITIDRATATQNVQLTSGADSGSTNAARSIRANSLQAGADVSVVSSGLITVGTATAGGALRLNGLGNVALGSGSAGTDINLNAADTVNPASLTTGTLTAGNDIVAGGAGAVSLGDVQAGGLLTANAASGPLGTGNLRAASDITLTSGGDIALRDTTATGGNISATARGNLSFASFTAAGSVLLNATGSLGTIDNGSIMAGDSISATTGGDLALGALAANNNLTLNAGGGLSIVDATASAGALTLTAGQALAVTSTGTAGTSAVFTAGGSVQLANVAVGGGITARSTGGGLNAGTLRAGDDLNLTSVGDLSLADGASARGAIALNGAAITVTTASAATNFSATGTGAVTIAAPLLSVGRGISLTAGGALTTNGLRAVNSISATGGSTVTLGDVESVGGTVRGTAGGSMTVGNVRAAGSIFLTAAAAINSGNLTAGTGPILPGEGGTTGTGGSAGGTDSAPGGIAPGFDGSSIVRCDDCFTDGVTLPFLVNYYGNTYDTTYVSNNGYLTFNSGQGAFTPTGLGASYRGQPIVAPFFADVDTRNAASAQTTYGTGTYAGRQAFGATYANVGYFSNQADKTNSFQIVLTNRADTGTGNFDIYYNYTNITWETGSASGGSGGFGGASAAVGFNAGTGGQPGTFFELPGSRIPGSFLNSGTAPLVTGTNNGTPGQLVFMVRNGTIATGGAAERPTVHVSNVGAGNTPADIRLGNISGEAAEVHGSGAVTVGTVSVGDRGSGIATTGQPYATVLDAATNLTTGNIMSTGLVALGARTGDLLGGTISTASSAAVLVGGSVQLGAVTTGTGAGDSLFVSAPTALVGTTPAAIDLGGLLGNGGFDATSLATATPVRTGGTLTIDGPVSTGNLVAAAGGASRIGAVTASNAIFVDNGAGLTLTTLAAGGDITAKTDGNLSFTSADAGGAVTLAAGGTLSPVDNGTISAGTSISATTGGDLAVGSLTANQNLTLVSGGALTLGSGTARAGALTLTAARTLAVTGAATAGGNAALTAGGDIATAGVTAGGGIAVTSSGGNVRVGPLGAAQAISLNGAGAVVANTLSAGTDVNATAGTNLSFTSADAGGAVTLAAGGTLSPIDNGTISAGTSISATTGGDLAVGSLTANQNLTLVSGGALTLGSGTARAGALTLTAARTLAITGAATAGGNAALTAGGDIATAGVTSGDTLAITSTGGTVTVTDLLAANGITARALGNLFVRDAVVNAGNGNLQLASGVPFTAATGAPFLLTGDTTISGTVSAATVTIQGGGDVSIGGNARIRSDGTINIASGDDIAVASGAVIGLGAITRTIAGTQTPDRTGGPSDVVILSAGALRNGTANLAANGASGIVQNGTIDGLSIALNSEAIDIGAGGQVGSASTNAVTFTNSGTGRTIVGGSGDTTTYALSNAALGRTRAQAIGVVAPADVTVQTLSLTGSAASNGNLTGGNAMFEIRSPGSVSVEGAVAVASAANTDLFSIVAGNRITVLSPSGSIALNGTGTGTNVPGGRIALAAPRIVVASATTAAALDGLASLDARDERLGINDGAVNDAGYLQANAIAFRVSSGLYIQNSGTGRQSDMRRGFTVGSGGVSIATTGTGPAEIAINGRQALADGTFATGKTLIGRLTLSGTGQATMASFDPRSTVNGCLIVGMNCRFDATAPTQPIQDVINQIINGQDDITGAVSSVVQQLNSPLIELIDFTPFRLAGIIDEPVTGAGNDDYYTSLLGDEDSISADVRIGEQVTGTGRDQTTDEQVTGTGKDQATDEQVTGTGRDQIEKPDGKCDPTRRKTDPDCRK